MRVEPDALPKAATAYDENRKARTDAAAKAKAAAAKQKHKHKLQARRHLRDLRALFFKHGSDPAWVQGVVLEAGPSGHTDLEHIVSHAAHGAGWAQMKPRESNGRPSSGIYVQRLAAALQGALADPDGRDPRPRLHIWLDLGVDGEGLTEPFSSPPWKGKPPMMGGRS